MKVVSDMSSLNQSMSPFVWSKNMTRRPPDSQKTKEEVTFQVRQSDSEDKTQEGKSG